MEKVVVFLFTNIYIEKSSSVHFPNMKKVVLYFFQISIIKNGFFEIFVIALPPEKLLDYELQFLIQLCSQFFVLYMSHTCC
jgi:hypothetical protein